MAITTLDYLIVLTMTSMAYLNANRLRFVRSFVSEKRRRELEALRHKKTN